MTTRSLLRARHRVRASFVAFALALPIAAFAQGALTPPGAPAPTMKSLSELDASLTAFSNRTTNVTPVDLLTGDATALYVISTPGTYLVRADISVAAPAVCAIRISSPNVTLDLGGHTLTGPGATVSTTAGIVVTGLVTPVVVRNGSVRAWYAGVTGGQASLVENVTVFDVRNQGISLSRTNSIVRGCRVYNASQLGIGAALVTDSTVNNVTESAPIAAMLGIEAGVVRDCTVSSVGNAGSAQSATGVDADVISGTNVTGVYSSATARGMLGSTVERVSVSTVNGGTSGIGITGKQVLGSFVTSVSGIAAYGISCETATDSRASSIASTTGLAYGIVCTNARGSSAETVSSASYLAYGFYGTALENCVAASISGGTGVYGIFTSNARGCVALSIDSGTSTAYGIRGLGVHDCRVENVDSSSSSAIGLDVPSSGIATHNSVNSVKNYGIRLSNGAVALANTVNAVGEGAGVTTGAGIFVIGADGRAEGNTVRGAAGADYGIRVTGSRNLIVKNNVAGTFTGASTGVGATGYDTSEFNIAPDNAWGQVLTMGNTPAGMITSNDGAWSNFRY